MCRVLEIRPTSRITRYSGFWSAYAKAQGGMSKLADDTELAREALYRMLSEDGNPTFTSISTVLHALGIQLQFVPAEHTDN